MAVARPWTAIVAAKLVEQCVWAQPLHVELCCSSALQISELCLCGSVASNMVDVVSRASVGFPDGRGSQFQASVLFSNGATEIYVVQPELHLRTTLLAAGYLDFL